jgi:hypothetical protein
MLQNPFGFLFGGHPGWHLEKPIEKQHFIFVGRCGPFQPRLR